MGSQPPPRCSLGGGRRGRLGALTFHGLRRAPGLCSYKGKARAKRGGGSERVEGFLISVSSYAVF